MNFINFLKDKHPENYLDEQLKNCKDYDELPRELVNCTCCERHRINFPILGNNNTYCKSSKDNSYKTEKTCTCPCRHFARHICREWDLVNEVEDINDTSDESSSEEEDSMSSFISEDEGMSSKTRKKLDKVIRKFKRG